MTGQGKVSTSQICHPEQSEGSSAPSINVLHCSLCKMKKILHSVQNDKGHESPLTVSFTPEMKTLLNKIYLNLSADLTSF
ncbi:hypothetical protein JN11_02435 [Mucilaginibacter frigoritolerans]|uniref:Uncharacterized protein n=1 Tax=Mucilaginibacter frigoritolerans TaxID=652788 RepID=A0A562U2I7_9SPHI|nr:hypothetical protein JN11_02435 [Mucilaginibacter frigoritolerans]